MPSLALVITAIVAVAGVFSMPTAAAGAPSSPLTWAARVPINPAAKEGGSISCPSSSLCVVVDRAQLTVSTDPTAAAAWHPDHLPSGTNLTDLSCPSDSLCVGIGAGSKCFHCPSYGTASASTDPATGTSWSASAKIDGSFTTGLACPSASLCVAVDQNGGIASSTDPAAGADTWSVVRPRFEDEPYLAGVSCPSSSRCVAVGDLWALSSTKPRAGKSAWKATRVKVPFPHPRLASLSAVSCPSVHLCVALPESHQRWIASSTNPFARSPRWKIAHLGFTPQESAISCPSVSLCAFGDYTGRIVTSTDPTGGGAAWEIADRDPRTTIDDLSCPDPTLCVAVDSHANAIVGTG